MHVDTVKIQFCNDGVAIFRAGIDFENIEFPCPVGLCIVVVAEDADIETLEGAAVLQGEDSIRLVVVPYAQFLHA